MKIIVKSQFEHDLDYLIQLALNLQESARNLQVYLGGDYKLHLPTDGSLVTPELLRAVEQQE